MLEFQETETKKKNICFFPHCIFWRRGNIYELATVKQRGKIEIQERALEKNPKHE